MRAPSHVVVHSQTHTYIYTWLHLYLFIYTHLHTYVYIHETSHRTVTSFLNVPIDSCCVWVVMIYDITDRFHLDFFNRFGKQGNGMFEILHFK